MAQSIKPAYTKGKWVVERYIDAGMVTQFEIQTELGSKVCSLYPLTLSAESNANLIASAPDLLEALESIRGIEAWIGDPKMKKLFQKKVYPTIDKARGL